MLIQPQRIAINTAKYHAAGNRKREDEENGKTKKTGKRRKREDEENRKTKKTGRRKKNGKT